MPLNWRWRSAIAWQFPLERAAIKLRTKERGLTVRWRVINPHLLAVLSKKTWFSENLNQSVFKQRLFFAFFLKGLKCCADRAVLKYGQRPAKCLRRFSIPKPLEDARLRQTSEIPEPLALSSEHNGLCDWAEREPRTSTHLQRRRV